MKKWIITLLTLGIIIVGGYFTLKGRSNIVLRYGNNPHLPTLTFYTSGLATTPQLAFWAGVKSGKITKLFNLKVVLWKNVDDLQNVLLAGKGDIWLGHIEGFALAKRRGAPVSLLAVTGWRKFYILSRNKGDKSIESFCGRTLPFAPVGSPAVPLLRTILKDKTCKIAFQPHDPKQLALMLARKQVNCALVPEPIVTMLLNKVRDLRIVLSVEDLYADRFGGKARMPIAGIAVNTRTAMKYPDKVKALQTILKNMADFLNRNKNKAPYVLPDEFSRFVPKKMVAQSLSRDIILVKTAKEAEPEIIKYFRIVFPSLVTKDGKLALDKSFIWE